MIPFACVERDTQSKYLHLAYTMQGKLDVGKYVCIPCL